MFVKALLAAATLGVAASSSHTRWHELSKETYTFDKYCEEYGLAYAAGERDIRAKIFDARLELILRHNADPSNTWKRGVNGLTDRTEAEIKAMKGLDKPLLHHLRGEAKTAPEPQRDQDLPATVDWRDKHVVTPVKNQGVCGSCWTFASAAVLESHWAIQTGELQELSEQFILDCTPNPHQCGGTGGCYGGTAELAYAQLAQYGGIPSEWTYPYLSGLGNASKCHGLPLVPEKPHSGSVGAAAKVTGYVDLATNSYAAMKDAIANIGPLAISVDAVAWHDYESGIFNGGNMTNPDLDHAVMLVGYGSDNGEDYWLVRNSWTPLWGEEGYIRLKRYGESGNPPCGTDITPQDGSACAGGPPTIEVCGQSGVLYDGTYPKVN